MPVHSALISAGAGSTIPISAGGGTSGDIQNELDAFGDVNIAGVFGSGTASELSTPILAALVIGGLIFGMFLLKRR